MLRPMASSASDTNYLPDQILANSDGARSTNRLSERSFAPSVTGNSLDLGESFGARLTQEQSVHLSKTLSRRANSVIDLKCSTYRMLHVWQPLAAGGESSKICHSQNFSGCAECQSLEPRIRSLRSAAILSSCARSCPLPSFR